MLTQNEMVRCFNEWMKRFVQEPEKFQHEWEAVERFLTQAADDREPDYGQVCTQYMIHLNEELSRDV